MSSAIANHIAADMICSVSIGYGVAFAIADGRTVSLRSGLESGSNNACHG